MSAHPRPRTLNRAVAHCAYCVFGPRLCASFHVKQSSRSTRRMTMLDSTMSSTCADHPTCGAFRAPVLRRGRSIAQVLIDLAVKPPCLSAPASCPFREARDHVALFEVNPGAGMAVTAVLGRNRSAATIFPGGERRLPRATKSPRLAVLRCRCGRRKRSRSLKARRYTSRLKSITLSSGIQYSFQRQASNSGCPVARSDTSLTRPH